MTRRLLMTGCIGLLVAASAYAATTPPWVARKIVVDKVSSDSLFSGKQVNLLKGASINDNLVIDTTGPTSPVLKPLPTGEQIDPLNLGAGSFFIVNKDKTITPYTGLSSAATVVGSQPTSSIITVKGVQYYVIPNTNVPLTGSLNSLPGLVNGYTLTSKNAGGVLTLNYSLPYTGTNNVVGKTPPVPVTKSGALAGKIVVDIGVATKYDKTYNNQKKSYLTGDANLIPFEGTAGGMTVLSGTVNAGGTLAGLSSEIAPAGTLAAVPESGDVGRINIIKGKMVLPTYAKGDVRATATKDIFGAVGSQATIVESDAVAANTTVSMEWRVRTAKEAHAYNKATSNFYTNADLGGDDSLPPGSNWLTSDVVNISGIANTTNYALDMTFDNRINQTFEGATNGSVANQLASLYITEFNPTSSNWQRIATKPGVDPTYGSNGHLESLSTFLAANSTYSLSDLVGQWGVDPSSASDGTGHSWVITAGSGIFAVAPEPSTLALLIVSAGIGVFSYGMRRRKSKIS